MGTWTGESRHANRKPDGPLTVAERNALVGAWLEKWPYPLALVRAKMPKLVWLGLGLGFDEEELNAQCVLGGVNAARLFDPAKGKHFNSFTYPHMVSYLERLVYAAARDRDRRAGAAVVSLAAPCGESGGPFAEVLAARPAGATGGQAEELVRHALDTLVPCPVDRRVALLRWGLEGGGPHTLTEVGGKLGLSKERVRQREARVRKRCGEQLEAILTGGAVPPPTKPTRKRRVRHPVHQRDHGAAGDASRG